MNLNKILQQARAKQPLVHCITNPISINQCANTILAVGGRPIMAEHPDEVAEITTTAQALVLNMGNITDARIKSMLISAEVAKEKGIPFVLDMVGIACSSLRRNFALELIKKSCLTVLKGNYSEIKALYDMSYVSSGVDADTAIDVEAIASIAQQLATKHKTIVVASGKTDIVTDGHKTVRIENGTQQLAAVTGTGCMLGALCGCYLAVSANMDAAVCACVVLGICGECAATDKGNGTFMVNLMDELSTIKDIESEAKIYA